MIKLSKMLSVAGAVPFGLLVACGGGSGGGALDDTTGLTSQIGNVPLAGQFLATCTDAGVAVIDGFVAGAPLPAAPVGLPTIEDVLAMADPAAIPVIGGLVPSVDDPTVLVPVSADDALAMLPAGGLPSGLPAIGNAPVLCSDVALPEGDLPSPTDALGLVPVFDGNGDVVALVLATVGSAGAPGVPSPATLELPTDTLPEPFGSAVGGIVALLPSLPSLPL